MKCSRRSFAVVSAVSAVLLSLSTETLNARDVNLAPLTLSAAQSAKQQCINTCRAPAYVRFWHKADIPKTSAVCPLSEVKRTTTTHRQTQPGERCAIPLAV
jgi:hypothetical protein